MYYTRVNPLITMYVYVGFTKLNAYIVTRVNPFVPCVDVHTLYILSSSGLQGVVLVGKSPHCYL